MRRSRTRTFGYLTHTRMNPLENSIATPKSAADETGGGDASDAFRGRSKRVTDPIRFDRRMRSTAVLLAAGARIAWPVIVAATLVTYREPARQIIGALADKVRDAETVTVGSLSLEVRRREEAIGMPGLVESVGRLGPSAVQLLLELSGEETDYVWMSKRPFGPNGSHVYWLPPRDQRDAEAQLERNGLIAGSEPLDSAVALFQRIATAKGIRPAENGEIAVPVDLLSPAEIQRIETITFRRTPRAKAAATIILETVAVALAADAKGGTSKK